MPRIIIPRGFGGSTGQLASVREEILRILYDLRATRPRSDSISGAVEIAINMLNELPESVASRLPSDAPSIMYSALGLGTSAQSATAQFAGIPWQGHFPPMSPPRPLAPNFGPKSKCSCCCDTSKPYDPQWTDFIEDECNTLSMIRDWLDLQKSKNPDLYFILFIFIALPVLLDAGASYKEKTGDILTLTNCTINGLEKAYEQDYNSVKNEGQVDIACYALRLLARAVSKQEWIGVTECSSEVKKGITLHEDPDAATKPSELKGNYWIQVRNIIDYSMAGDSFNLGFTAETAWINIGEGTYSDWEVDVWLKYYKKAMAELKKWTTITKCKPPGWSSVVDLGFSYWLLKTGAYVYFKWPQ